MDAPKYMTLEKKDKHKLLTFSGVFLSFIVTTFILYILAQNKESTIYAPIIAVAFPLLAGIGANYLGKKSDKKKRDNQDSWNIDGNGLEKIKKSRFSKFSNRQFGDISYFGAILSLIATYLSIYLSEVLNLTESLHVQYPDNSFSAIFISVIKNIFKENWSRKYLVGYWIWATIFIIILMGTTIWGVKQIEKMRKKEQEQRERNKNNNISKFN